MKQFACTDYRHHNIMLDYSQYITISTSIRVHCTRVLLRTRGCLTKVPECRVTGLNIEEAHSPPTSFDGLRWGFQAVCVGTQKAEDSEI